MDEWNEYKKDTILEYWPTTVRDLILNNENIKNWGLCISGLGTELDPNDDIIKDGIINIKKATGTVNSIL